MFIETPYKFKECRNVKNKGRRSFKEVYCTLPNKNKICAKSQNAWIYDEQII
jgi:hypothetical protein